MASGYDDMIEILRIAFVWAVGVEIEDLQICKRRFRKFDVMLGIELERTCPPHIKRKIEEYNAHLSLEGTLLGGREILWLILKSFEFDDQMAWSTTINDLRAPVPGRQAQGSVLEDLEFLDRELGRRHLYSEWAARVVPHQDQII